MELYSPLRYPGGKAKLAPYVKRLISDNHLLDGIYVEPYVGGGGVALSLLFDEYVSRIVINDKDKSIYSFWYVALHHCEELCQLIQDTPITIESWNIQKEVQRHKDDADMLQLAFSTFFLNRTNRSGILNAGIIGGRNQTGNYKIDARFNKEELIKRIRKIFEYSDRITLYNEDAVSLTKRLCDELADNTLFYFDPPYFKKGSALYMNFYHKEDHQEIAETIKNINKKKWILTYDNEDFIRNLYHGFRNRTFELNYSANNTGRGKEIMFYSSNIRHIPNF